MAKVTSKLQVTIPKAIASRYGIEPGSDIEWEEANEVIRVVPPRVRRVTDQKTRLRMFDAATARQRKRQQTASTTQTKEPLERGWRREDLYERGRSR